ncbi:MAG: hypothetical protein KGN84_06985 [Acidobacteriota bacterium]|nr:hypothetical protein [Acidobacteriota bacterium]
MLLTNQRRTLLSRTALIGAAALLLFFTVRTTNVQAQRNDPPAPAQVSTASPLPVYVVNDTPRLPEGFVAGSNWRFTSWTTPSSLTFTANVRKTNGSWALLAVTSGGATKNSWYYIPYMPGTWETQ